MTIGLLNHDRAIHAGQKATARSAATVELCAGIGPDELFDFVSTATLPLQQRHCGTKWSLDVKL